MNHKKDSGRKPRRSAEDWVLAAFKVMATSSIDAVKVERLAKDLGVTKGSFYWHFADRPALLDAMRELWVRMGTEQIIELVGERAPSPGSQDESQDAPHGAQKEASREALRALIDLTLVSADEFEGVEAAIREWSAHDPETAKVCAAVDERRLSYVIGLLTSAGVSQKDAAARAGVLYRVLIGDYTYRRHGGHPVDVAEVQAIAERFFE